MNFYEHLKQKEDGFTVMPLNIFEGYDDEVEGEVVVIKIEEFLFTNIFGTPIITVYNLALNVSLADIDMEVEEDDTPKSIALSLLSWFNYGGAREDLVKQSISTEAFMDRVDNMLGDELPSIIRDLVAKHINK